jgi:hypothetical protein
MGQGERHLISVVVMVPTTRMAPRLSGYATHSIVPRLGAGLGTLLAFALRLQPNCPQRVWVATEPTDLPHALTLLASRGVWPVDVDGDRVRLGVERLQDAGHELEDTIKGSQQRRCNDRLRPHPISR